MNFKIIGDNLPEAAKGVWCVSQDNYITENVVTILLTDILDSKQSVVLARVANGHKADQIKAITVQVVGDEGSMAFVEYRLASGASFVIELGRPVMCGE